MATQGKDGIAWTEETWNPVTGCTKVSQGCKHCYAERVFPRVYSSQEIEIVGQYADTTPRTRERRFTDVRCHPERLDQPLRWKRPRRVFVNSMSDLFHEDVPFEFIDGVFAVMALAQEHTAQVLTKRPERMAEYMRDARGRISALLHKAIYEQSTDDPIFGSIAIAYRRRREDVAYRSAWRQSEAWGGSDNSMREAQGRVPEPGRLSAGGSDDQQCEVCGERPQTCVDLPQRADRGRINDQSQERGEVGQQAGEPGTSNLQRAATACVGSSKRESQRAEGIEASQDIPPGIGCSGNAEAEGRRLDGQGHCYEVRDEAKGGISDLQSQDLASYLTWPLPNVWLGVSCEDQATADERIPLLLRTPAAVRWVSFEPLLGPVDFSRWLPIRRSTGIAQWVSDGDRCDLHWAVVGGESGPRARPMELAWARSLRDQCKAAGVAMFMKQICERGRKIPYESFPADLQIREYPR